MTSASMNENEDPSMGDRDLLEVEAMLAELAAADRAAAPFGLEARLVAKAVPIAARGAMPDVIPMAPAQRSWLLRTPARAAAGIALAGAMLAAVIGARSTGGVQLGDELSALAENDMEVLLAISAAMDDSSTDELSAIHSDAATLSERVRSTWTGSDWLDEGAM